VAVLALPLEEFVPQEAVTRTGAAGHSFLVEGHEEEYLPFSKTKTLLPDRGQNFRLNMAGISVRM